MLLVEQRRCLQGKSFALMSGFSTLQYLSYFKITSDICSSKKMFSKMSVSADREGDFSVHLHSCFKMMAYLFAAGHVNYARYSLCYLRTMHKLPEFVLQQFLRDEQEG